MSEKKEKYTAVVLAAGKGTRMGGSVAKQFLEIGGKQSWFTRWRFLNIRRRLTRSFL